MSEGKSESIIKYEFLSHINKTIAQESDYRRLIISDSKFEQVRYDDKPLEQVTARIEQNMDFSFLNYTLEQNFEMFDENEPMHYFSDMPYEIVIQFQNIEYNCLDQLKFYFKFAIFERAGVLRQISEWISVKMSTLQKEYVFDIDENNKCEEFTLIGIIEKDFSLNNEEELEEFEKIKEVREENHELFDFGINTEYTKDEYECVFALDECEESELRRLAVYYAFADVSLLSSAELQFKIQRVKHQRDILSDNLLWQYDSKDDEEIPIKIEATVENANLLLGKGKSQYILDVLINDSQEFSPNSECISEEQLERLQHSCVDCEYERVGEKYSKAHKSYIEQSRFTNKMNIEPMSIQLNNKKKFDRSFIYLEISARSKQNEINSFEVEGQECHVVHTEVISKEHPYWLHDSFVIKLKILESGSIDLEFKLYELHFAKSETTCIKEEVSKKYSLKAIGQGELNLVNDLYEITVKEGETFVKLYNENDEKEEMGELELRLTYDVESLFSKDKDRRTSTELILYNQYLLYNKTKNNGLVDYERESAKLMKVLTDEEPENFDKRVVFLIMECIINNSAYLLTQPNVMAEDIIINIELLFEYLSLALPQGTIKQNEMQYEIMQEFNEYELNYKDNEIFESFYSRLFQNQAKEQIICSKSERPLKSEENIKIEELDNEELVYMFHNVTLQNQDVISILENWKTLVDNVKQDIGLFQTISEFLIFIAMRCNGEWDDDNNMRIVQLLNYFFSREVIEKLNNKQIMSEIALLVSKFLPYSEIFSESIFKISASNDTMRDVEYYEHLLFIFSKVLSYCQYESEQNYNEIESKQTLINLLVTDGFRLLFRKVLNDELYYKEPQIKHFLKYFVNFAKVTVLCFLQQDSQYIPENSYRILFEIASQIFSQLRFEQDFVLLFTKEDIGMLKNIYLYLLCFEVNEQSDRILDENRIRNLIELFISEYENGIPEEVTVHPFLELLLQNSNDLMLSNVNFEIQNYQYSNDIVSNEVMYDQLETQFQVFQLAILNNYMSILLYLVIQYENKLLVFKYLFSGDLIECLINLLNFKYINIKNITIIYNILYHQIGIELRKYSYSCEGYIFKREAYSSENLLEIRESISEELFEKLLESVWKCYFKYYRTNTKLLVQLLHYLILFDIVIYSGFGKNMLSGFIGNQELLDQFQTFVNRENKQLLGEQLKTFISPEIEYSELYSEKVDNAKFEQQISGVLTQLQLDLKENLETTISVTSECDKQIDGRTVTDYAELINSYIRKVKKFSNEYEQTMNEYKIMINILKKHRFYLETAFQALHAALYISRYINIPSVSELLRYYHVAKKYVSGATVCLYYVFYGSFRKIIPYVLMAENPLSTAENTEKLTGFYEYLELSYQYFRIMNMASFYTEIDTFIKLLKSSQATSLAAICSIMCTEIPRIDANYNDEHTYYAVRLVGQYLPDNIYGRQFIYHYTHEYNIQSVREHIREWFGQMYHDILVERGKIENSDKIEIFENKDIPGQEQLQRFRREWSRRTEDKPRDKNADRREPIKQSINQSLSESYSENTMALSMTDTCRSADSPDLVKSETRYSKIILANTKTQEKREVLINNEYFCHKLDSLNDLYTYVNSVEQFPLFSEDEAQILHEAVSEKLQELVQEYIKLRMFLIENKDEYIDLFDYMNEFSAISKYNNQKIETSSYIFFQYGKYAGSNEDSEEIQGVVQQFFILDEPMPQIELKVPVAEELYIYIPPKIKMVEEFLKEITRIKDAQYSYLNVDKNLSNYYSVVTTTINSPVSEGGKRLHEFFAYDNSESYDECKKRRHPLLLVEQDFEYPIYEVDLSESEESAIYQYFVNNLYQLFEECMKEINEVINSNPVEFKEYVDGVREIQKILDKDKKEFQEWRKK